DGLFDVCTIDYTPLLRALKLLPIVKKGEHLGLPEVTCYLAKSVSIESQHSVNMQMDGETSNAKSFSVENLPAALLLRVYIYIQSSRIWPVIALSENLTHKASTLNIPHTLLFHPTH